MEQLHMSTFDARLKRHFGMLCIGPPMAGKTFFVLELLKHVDKLIDKPFDYIYWFYGERSSAVEYLERQGVVRTVSGLPDDLNEYIHRGAEEETTGKPMHGLLIFDDLMQDMSSSEQISNLTTNKCQHQNVSWIALMQNAFHRGKSRLTMLRCCHYMVLFKNPMDQSVAHHLARRIWPSSPETFIRIYEKATQRPNGYLFVDGCQTTPNEARFRTDIFGDQIQKAFVPTQKRRSKGKSTKPSNK